MIKMRSLRTILSLSLAMSLLFGTAVYASEDDKPDLSDEQMIEVTGTEDETEIVVDATDSYPERESADGTFTEPTVIISDESEDDAVSGTDTAGSSEIIYDYNHEGTVYMMVGESYHYGAFEDPAYDRFFQGKRTQKPKYSKNGILSGSKKKDKDGVTRFHFKAVKPGTTELSFIVTHKDGCYETERDTFIIIKPYLSKTKFDNITSLNTVINMQDYLGGYEGFTRDIYVNWDSSKKSVAEVDENGVVTMKGPGTTKITGTLFTNNDGMAKVSATVTVKVPKMSKSSVTLIPGQKTKITLGNMPKGKTVDKWELSSWGYKVRDEGYREGLEKTENGNSCEISAFMECGGRLTATVDGDTFTCDIEVKAPKIKKTEMKINKGKSSKISVGGTKFKPNVFTYATNDYAVAVVDENGKVTAVGSGTTYIDVYLYQTKACPRTELPNGGRVMITVP